MKPQPIKTLRDEVAMEVLGSFCSDVEILSHFTSPTGEAKKIVTDSFKIADEF